MAKQARGGKRQQALSVTVLEQRTYKVPALMVDAFNEAYAAQDMDQLDELLGDSEEHYAGVMMHTLLVEPTAETGGKRALLVDALKFYRTMLERSAATGRAEQLELADDLLRTFEKAGRDRALVGK